MHACLLCFTYVPTVYFNSLIYFQTALHHAAMNNETDIASLLIKHGADPQIQSASGMCDL